MSHVIELIAFAGSVTVNEGTVIEDFNDHWLTADLFLASFDPDAYDGLGHATWTDDPTQAMLFDDARAALKCWNTVSTVRPIRADGKPNKPMTAFTVQVRQF